MSRLLRVAFMPVVFVMLAGLVAHVSAQEPHWDYLSHGGPEHWGDEFPDCNLPGQSPVNIQGVTPRAGVSIDYRPTPLVVFNNGHTIQVAYERGSFMTVDGKRYELLQFHFHTPSEHTFNGAALPLEVHFVHRATDGELAVLGALMTEGAEGPSNRALADILEVMPQEPGNAASLRPVQADDLLPGDLAFYSYDGSLTTPPCSGGVKWYVLSETLPVAPSLLRTFRELEFLNHDGQFVGNARPVQPLDGRLGDMPPLARITAPSTGSAGLAAK